METAEYRETRTERSSPLGDDDYTEPFGEPNELLAPPIANDDTVVLPEPESTPSRERSEPLSLAELREEMLNTTIRSSASPSPLKMPSREATVSPVKIPEEAEEELKKKLSSLLGKRPSEDDDVLPVLRQKRARPKSKVITLSVCFSFVDWLTLRLVAFGGRPRRVLAEEQLGVGDARRRTDIYRRG